MTNNASIFRDYRVWYWLYTKDQVLDLYGKDYLDDYGHDVPQVLLDRYLAMEKEFNAIQLLLVEVYNKRG